MLGVITLNVDVPEPVTDAGLKLAVAPDGNPLTLRLTLLLNPFNGLTVAVAGAAALSDGL